MGDPHLGPWPWRNRQGEVVPEDWVSDGMLARASLIGGKIVSSSVTVRIRLEVAEAGD